MSDIVKAAGSASLGAKNPDRAAAMARALAGSVPIAGPFLAEALTAVIPNQRLDRVEAFLLLLAKEIEKRSASEKITVPSSIPLIEEGLSQAARAFTPERRAYLARCVAEGVDAEEKAKLHELKILQILGEIGDDDLLLLDANSGGNGWEKLRALQPPFVSASGSDEAHAQWELHRASYRRLEGLGLLNFSMSKGEFDMPQYENNGQLKGHHYVSALGRQVLARVGLNSPSDAAGQL